MLEPYPAQILYFAQAPADWAARQDEAELAVHLLAGAAPMRETQQSGRDRLIDRAVDRAWRQVRLILDAATLERCARQGREMSPEPLRTQALRWRVTTEGAPSGLPIALQP